MNLGPHRQASHLYLLVDAHLGVLIARLTVQVYFACYQTQNSTHRSAQIIIDPKLDSGQKLFLSTF